MAVAKVNLIVDGCTEGNKLVQSSFIAPLLVWNGPPGEGRVQTDIWLAAWSEKLRGSPISSRSMLTPFRIAEWTPSTRPFCA